MLGNISDVSIVVSAILAVAVGSIWYSPLFFGGLLLKTTSHTFDDSEESRRVLLKHVFVGVLVQILFLIFVAQFIIVSGTEVATLLRTGVSLSGIIIGTLLTLVVVEKRSIVYFLIHAGYMVVVLFGGLFVIAKWPW